MSADRPARRYTFATELEARAASTPDKVFLWFDGQPVTYAEQLGRSRSAANSLLALGVAPGEVVALFTTTCREWVDVWLGAPEAGILTAPVNVMFQGEFLRRQLADAAVTAIVVDAAFLSRVFEIADGVPSLRTVLVRDLAGEVPPSPTGLAVLPATALADGPQTPAGGERSLGWNDPATLFYTSGTTGPSKAAVLTQHYLCATGELTNSFYRTTPDDVMYASVPLFHVSGAMGIVAGTLVTGRSAALDRSFHVTTWAERIRHFGATQFLGVGAMIMMLWNQPESPEDQTLPLRLMIGAPIPPELHARIEDRYGCTVLAAYGLTEAITIAAQRIDEPRLPGSAGRPGPFLDVRIVDGDDEDVSDGTVGEIVCRPRSPHVMFEGYHGRPADTLAQCRNLWFHTGDLGRLESGQLFFVDRQKDAIRRRGENISSFEVERAILRHPSVLECAAHAVPSPLGEDDVKICVVLRPGADSDPKELMDHCVEAIPAFALPRYIELVDSLPKNQVGRVQKHILRDRAAGDGTWDREAAGYVIRH